MQKLILEKILNKKPREVFLKLMFFSATFHLVAAIFTEGFHRPDEHLGMMRYVAYKLGMIPLSELSWEYTAKIRPWSQAGIYIYFIKMLNFLGLSNPFFLSSSLRLLSSALGFYSIFLLSKISMRFLMKDLSKNLMLFALALLWYLPFFHARTTTENFGITFFIFGIYPLLKKIPSDFLFSPKVAPLFKDKKWEISHQEALFSGLLLGFSFVFRFQMSVMIGFWMIWLLLFSRIKILNLILMGTTIILSIALNTLIDYWGHGHWTFTPWNYLYQNIFKGVASGFGVSPWYYFLTKTFAKAVPPFSLLLIIPMGWLWIKKPLHLLTWITLPYFLAHSIIGHKELRFIFALGLFSPLILAIFFENLKNKNIFNKRWMKVLLILCFLENTGALLISSFKPAYGPINYYKFLYSLEKRPQEIYTVGTFRDQLKFYLKGPLKEIIINSSEIEMILAKKNEAWFLTDKYRDIQFFQSRLENCRERYISYPHWVFKFNIGNWLKRSKIWALYQCAER